MNNPAVAVEESLAGFAAAHNDLISVDLESRVIVRRGGPVAGKVAVISGGGSGHEPMHAGYVGRGMLDAACAGLIFSSPPPGSILRATEAVYGGSGVVYVVKNYTGDVLNFGLAANRAEEAGMAVECVNVADDVATGEADGTGRRGTGATVLVQKLTGAAADRGGSLETVAEIGRRASAAARSYGVALSSCIAPEVGTPTFELGPNEIEFGVGIHGERGRRRTNMMRITDIVEEMIRQLLTDLHAPPRAKLLTLVNGLGGTPLMELYIAHHELVAQLARKGLTAARSLVGNYVTTLQMEGLSITLLVLDDELAELWDYPVHTARLRWLI